VFVKSRVWLKAEGRKTNLLMLFWSYNRR